MTKSRIIICLLVAVFCVLALIVNPYEEFAVDIVFIINQVFGYVIMCTVVIFAHETVTNKSLTKKQQSRD